MMEENTRVYTASGELEAQQIKAFLESNDITCRFQGESLRKTHGLTLNGLGSVEIYVPASQAKRARELLSKAEAGELELEAADD